MSRFIGKKGLAVLLVLLIAPLPILASGVGDIISLLTTITSTLRDGIGKVLGGIQTVKTTQQTIQQKVIWPLDAINQAKSSVLQVRTKFTNLASQIQSIPVQSATLVNPKQLESLLRSGQSSNIQGLQPAFQRLYGMVPAQTDAAIQDRNLADVDDATATGSLKTAIVSDQASQQMLGVADALEQQAGTASPGSAPFLTAQATVVNLQNQAYLQRMLAAELRQEATRLAHDNALLKRSAETSRQMRNTVQQIFNRP